MKTFREYYIKVILLVLYFWLLLPWSLSQASDVIVISGFLSLFGVLYFIVAEGVKIYKKLN